MWQPLISSPSLYLSFVFQLYAEKQFPGNPEQQAVLIHQLQKEHYHQYMQQLHLQTQSQAQTKDGGEEANKMSKAPGGEGECGQPTPANNEPDNVDLINAMGGLQLSNDLEQEQHQQQLDEQQLQTQAAQDVCAETGLQSGAYDEYVLIRPAKMWTRPDIRQFKTEVSAGDGDGVITIGHGDTVTVRKSQ